MSQKIYASFSNEQEARAAINKLIKNGLHADQINMTHKEDNDAGLNPAQNDYPEPAAGTETALSSAPPQAPRDYNKGIEADNYNQNYKDDVDTDMHKDVAAPPLHPNEGPAPLEAYAREGLTPRGSEPGNIVDPENQHIGAMAGTFPDLRAAGPGGMSGSDSFSASLGTRTASIGATANAANNPGGMSDFLWDSLPTDFAHYYRQQFEDGCAILTVSAETEEEARKAEDLLRHQGASRVERNSYMA